MKTRKNKRRGGSNDEHNEIEATDISYIQKAEVPQNSSGRPTVFTSNYTRLHPRDVFSKLKPSVEAETIPINASVLGTTYKNRDNFTRVYRKLGKITGIIPRTEPGTYRNIDFDDTIFKGTCLQHDVLTVDEINVILSNLRFNRDKEAYIMRVAPKICEIKSRLMEKDPNFINKYLHIYLAILSLILSEYENSDNLIDLMMMFVDTATPQQLARRDASFRSSDFAPGSDLTERINTAFYDEGTGYQYLRKAGNGRKKTKRVKLKRKKLSSPRSNKRRYM